MHLRIIEPINVEIKSLTHPLFHDVVSMIRHLLHNIQSSCARSREHQMMKKNFIVKYLLNNRYPLLICIRVKIALMMSLNIVVSNSTLCIFEV